MTEPFDPDLEPIDLDVRSPGERMADSGRAALARLQRSAERIPFGTLSVVWFLAMIVAVAGESYQALRYGSSFGGGGFNVSIWLRFYALGNAGAGAPVGMFVGLVLAALGGGPRGRLACKLAVLIGIWSVVCSAAGFAAAVHGFGFGPVIPGAERVGFMASALGALGFAVVATFLAWGLLSMLHDGEPGLSEPASGEVS